MTPMDTQVPGSVPSTQLRTWSHALLAADSALLMPRICMPHARLCQRLTLTTEELVTSGVHEGADQAKGTPPPLLPAK